MKSKTTNLHSIKLINDITLLSSEDSLPKSVELKEIHLNYPKEWFSPVKISPFFNTIEKETVDWMHSLGLIPSEEIRKHIIAMDPRHYAGYSLPLSSYEHALLYCKYITMWLLWDDNIVEKSDTFNSDISEPLLALAGENISDVKKPYVLAFKHIGDEYERLGATRSWRVRFANKMEEWARNAIIEEDVRQSNLERSFDEAVRLRSITVGIRPNSLPLEMSVGFELPQEIYNNPVYLEILEQVAIICCIINDLVGVPKDLRNNQINSNLVLFNMTKFQVHLEQAYKNIIEYHDRAILKLDSLSNQLLQNCKESHKERLKEIIYNLRYMDTGFGFWHQDCIRYQNLLPVIGNRAFRIKIHEDNKISDLIYNSVVTVDKEGREIGLIEKKIAHLGEGFLHKAFSVILFTKDMKVLIQKRSALKSLWPNFWSGTCCSHPRFNESFNESIFRRLNEELGISVQGIKLLYSFQYHATYENSGSENELCSVFIGVLDGNYSVNINKDEVSEIKEIEFNSLYEKAITHPNYYTPWFVKQIIKLHDEFMHTINEITNK